MQTMMMVITMGFMAAIRLAITAMGIRTGILMATTITVSAELSLSLDTLAMEICISAAANVNVRLILEPSCILCISSQHQMESKRLRSYCRGLHSLRLMHVSKSCLQAARNS